MNRLVTDFSMVDWDTGAWYLAAIAYLNKPHDPSHISLISEVLAMNWPRVGLNALRYEFAANVEGTPGFWNYPVQHRAQVGKAHTSSGRSRSPAGMVPALDTPELADWGLNYLCVLAARGKWIDHFLELPWRIEYDSGFGPFVDDRGFVPSWNAGACGPRLGIFACLDLIPASTRPRIREIVTEFAECLSRHPDVLHALVDIEQGHASNSGMYFVGRYAIPVRPDRDAEHHAWLARGLDRMTKIRGVYEGNFLSAEQMRRVDSAIAFEDRLRSRWEVDGGPPWQLSRFASGSALLLLTTQIGDTSHTIRTHPVLKKRAEWLRELFRDTGVL